MFFAVAPDVCLIFPKAVSPPMSGVCVKSFSFYATAHDCPAFYKLKTQINAPGRTDANNLSICSNCWNCSKSSNVLGGCFFKKFLLFVEVFLKLFGFLHKFSDMYFLEQNRPLPGIRDNTRRALGVPYTKYQKNTKSTFHLPRF